MTYLLAPEKREEIVGVAEVLAGIGAVVGGIERAPQRVLVDRLTGLACFDADHPRAADETQRCLEGGLSGVGELAYYEDGITAESSEACDRGHTS